MSTLITSPFGAETTAEEVVAGVDLTGKRAIVTCASSGIGVETARALASVRRKTPYGFSFRRQGF
jgi:hypothetical protein